MDDDSRTGPTATERGYTFPSEGTSMSWDDSHGLPFRIFLDSQHNGVVPTAQYTATAADFSQAPAEAIPPPPPAAGHPGVYH